MITSSEFRVPPNITIPKFRRPSTPRCSVRSAARFARRTTVQSYHEQTTYTNLWDRRSKSARLALLDTGRTGEESAADALVDYLEERPLG
jgi:hypothetical protein